MRARHFNPSVFLIIVSIVLLGIASCSSGGSSSGGGAAASAALVSIAVTPASPSIAKGTYVQFTANGTFDDNSTHNITATATWTSSDTSVATVDGFGRVTGVAAGTSTITATEGSFSATGTATVTNATLVSMTATPANASIVQGGSQQYTVMGIFSDNNLQDLTTQVAWTSSNPAKASVDNNGKASGLAAGTATITATSGTVAATADLTVTASPASAPPAGSVQISGSVAPDPGDPTATSSSASGATVYAVGQQNNAVTTDGNGNYTLYVNPQLSGTVMASPHMLHGLAAPSIMMVPEGTTTLTYDIVVVDANDAYGHTVQVQIVTNQSNTVATIYINQTGSITGRAYLQGQTDNSGITVNIPGTSFSAITAADGSYTINGVPSGDYQFLRAEKFGTTYHYAILSDITVDSNAKTTVPDMTLQLSTGPFGGILINGGAAFTTSADTTLSIAPSSDAVLMSVSSEPTFVGASWEPVQATTPFTIPGDFSHGGSTANVYVKFAQESGLASEPVGTAIYIDTNPMATLLSPPSITMSQNPVLEWQYSAPMPSPLYHVQLANNPGFTSPIVDVSGLSDPTYTVPTTLSQGTYYWHVAINYQGSDLNWSLPTGTFRVDRTAGTLSQPTNTVINNATPTFTWLPNPSAVSYRFTLSLNSNLANPVRDQSGIVGSSYGPISPLSSPTASTIYYWAITPYDYAGNPGTQSSIGSFTLDTVAPGGSIAINNNDTFAASITATLNLSATDDSSVTAYYVSESASTPSLAAPGWVSVPSGTTISASPTFTLSSTSGVKTVYVWFKDKAGNRSSSFSDTIDLINFTDNIQTLDTAMASRCPSIAAGSGTSFIAYTDQMNTGVKYINDYSGSWTVPVYIDAAGWSGANHSLFYTGSSLHAAYTGGSSTNWSLMYALKSSIIQSEWTTTVVDSLGSVGWTPSIVADANNKAFISYRRSSDGMLRFATNVLGSWQTYTVDGSSLSKTQAYNTSLARDTTGRMHIAYYDPGTKTLKYAYADSPYSSWSLTTVDNSSSDIGQYPSLGVDSNNHVHIAYLDYTSGALKYATNASGIWSTTTIDPGIGQLGTGAQPISLAIDPTNNFVFVSYATSTLKLKLATNQFGGWATAVADASGMVYDTSIALGSSGYYIAIAYFDRNGYVLKHTHQLNPWW